MSKRAQLSEALALDEKLSKLTETLHYRGHSGAVVAIVTLSPKRISWYGLIWPSEDKIFGLLNLSIGAKGNHCNGCIHRYNDRAPSKFRHGFFTPATTFGLGSGWVALVNIDVTLNVDFEVVPF